MQGFKILAVFVALVSLAAAKEGKFSFPKPPQKREGCLNKEDGTFLPVAGSCSKYVICFNGKANEQSCGGGYLFNARLSICDLPDRAGCALPETLTTALPQRPQTTRRPAIPSVTDRPVIIPNPSLPPCWAVANGISLPVPGNQNQYYFCLNNKAFLKDCGNMYFNVEYSACALEPSNSSYIEKPLPPTNVPEYQSSVCVGRQNGVTIPLAGNRHQYTFCLNNKAYLKDCGREMIFSTKYSACALPSDESHEEIEQPTDFEELARSMCVNKPFGSRYSFPGSCTKYIICTSNKGFVKSCGWREFNSNTASCDLPSNVRCQAQIDEAKKPQTPVPTTPKPASTVSPLAQRICLNQKDGVFVAAPGRCSDFFFCLKKQGYPKTCGENRHFDPKNMICVNSKESRCVDIFPKKSQRSIMPRAESNCANLESGSLLKSSDCGKFLICDNGKAVEIACPAGLHFNAEDNVCDWPANAKCS